MGIHDRCLLSAYKMPSVIGTHCTYIPALIFLLCFGSYPVTWKIVSQYSLNERMNSQIPILMEGKV